MLVLFFSSFSLSLSFPSISSPFHVFISKVTPSTPPPNIAFSPVALRDPFAKVMGETKITDFFGPKTLTRKPSRPSASASAERLRRSGSQGGASEKHQPNARLSSTKPSSQRLTPRSASHPAAMSPQGSQKSRKSAASISIPSTPPSPVVTSNSTATGRRTPRYGHRIPETPRPARRKSISHIPSLRTPDKPLPPAWGSSPFTPIDISSADDSSDSDCRIQRVIRTPSRKRKESDSTPSKTQPKRSRTNGLASAPPPKLQPRLQSQARSKSARAPATRAMSLPPVSIPSTQSGSILRHPMTPTTRNSRPIARSARLANMQSRVASSSQFVGNGEDSDCIIEKVQKSPMKRRQSDPANNAPAKKRRTATEPSVPAINSHAANEDSGSHCKILEVIHTPTKPILSRKEVRPRGDAQDGDASSKEISVPRSATVGMTKNMASSSSHSVSCPRTPTTLLLLKSPSLSQAKESPMIDLTQDSSSDSDDWDGFEDALESQSQVRLP
jgi:hypothetical protein